ncbi:MAG: phosphatase PAP2 family protein [Telluria sp.]
MQIWEQITSLGGLSFTAPIALFLALLMATGGHARLAWHWCWLFALAMLAVMATKIAFLGWGIGFREADFAGLSGHAARAAAVFPVALHLLFQNERPALRDGATMFGVLCAAVVSWSRVKVHAHPPSEAWLGFAFGTFAAALFIARMDREDRFRLSPWLVALCIAILLVRPHRDPVDSEKWMAIAAMKLSGHDRTWQRWSWKPARRPYQVRCLPPEQPHGYRCS